jgi:hypothetical protein
MKTRLQGLMDYFKDLENNYSTQQIIYALEDGSFLKEWCDESDQEDIEFIHDFYSTKLKKEV